MSAHSDLRSRERILVLSGLLTLTALAWGYTAHMAAMPSAMHSSTTSAMSASMAPSAMVMALPETRVWGVSQFLPLFAMWSVMMVAMMVPSATPVVLLVAGVSRGRQSRGERGVPLAVFLLGYLLVWLVYAAAAAATQLVLHNRALLSASATATPLLGGALLIAAGIFQWTPLKQACLRHCRSPLHFLSTQWREGMAGALRMGLKHGSYCLGCCWLLMALLFVAGVMNLVWVAALAGFVLIEKVAPGGKWVGRFAGVLLAAWGGLLLVTGAS